MRFYLVIFMVIGFLINLIWENIHAQLYATSIYWMEKMFYIPCSLGDVLLLTLSYFTIALGVKNWRWGVNPKFAHLLYLLFFSAIMAYVAEKIAIHFNWWQYKEEMPRIPFLGIGLSPLLQITLTPFIALVLSSFVYKQFIKIN